MNECVCVYICFRIQSAAQDYIVEPVFPKWIFILRRLAQCCISQAAYNNNKNNNSTAIDLDTLETQ